MSLVVLDLEIERQVESHPDGWKAARRGDLGVSVVCTLDQDTDQYSFYDSHNMEDLVSYLEAVDCVVGFNTQDFDIPRLEGYLKRHLNLQGQYDILQEVWKALGGRHKGYGLGPICERTLGLSKGGNGEFAPALFQQGRFAELYTYCQRDVTLTARLFNHVLEEGWIVDVNGERLVVRPKEDNS